MSAQPDVIEDDVVLEPAVDGEAAADTAPPADVPPAPLRKITLAEMYAWLADQHSDRQTTELALRSLGGDASRVANDVQMLVAVSNAIAFLIDNEAGFREYRAAAKEQENVVKFRPKGRRAR